MTALLPMLLITGLALGGLLPAVALAWWLLKLGSDGGDRPGDATSRLRLDSDGRVWLSVTNRSSTPVVVGALTRDERRLAFPSLTPTLVVRGARRRERGPAARWSEAVLGAVAPGAQTQWPVPVVVNRTRLLVAIGQPGRGLRIHDHLVTAPAPVAGAASALAGA